MRIQVSLSDATGNELNRRAEAWGMDRSVLVEHVLRTWITREHSITLTVAAPSRSDPGPTSISARFDAEFRRPQYASETTGVAADDDQEDTAQCKDCAEVVPLSRFTPGMEHRDCEKPGANIVALRREAMGLAPL